jgi:pimeloyl-ACP methyl ester carboxylesterase
MENLDSSRVRCGYFTVPENRDDDRGRRLRLAFAVIRRTGAQTPDDALLHLSGGPGLPGLSGLFLQRLAPVLAQDRDVVTFDQRGTGHSEPRLCPERNPEDARIAALPGNGTERRRLLRIADLACRDQMLHDSVDLRAYHSLASADDTEDLRRALGYGQWTLLGTSYGGALAQRVMNRHPASIRAAVLNVPVRFSDPLEFDFVRLIGGTLRAMNAICAADSICRRDHPDLESEFYRIAESFVHRPMTIGVDSALFGRSTFVVDAADFITVFDEITARDWELQFIPPLLRAMGKRDSVVVTRAIERTFGITDFGGFSPGMQMTVRCHDFALPETRSQWQAVIDTFPLEGEMWFGQDVCNEWPSGRVSQSERELGTNRVPTLILSGAYDNRAPPAYSAGIMRTFQNSKQIVFPNAAHALPGPTTFACFKDLVIAFARDPNVFPDGGCVTTTRPVTVTSDLPDWAR